MSASGSSSRTITSPSICLAVIKLGLDSATGIKSISLSSVITAGIIILRLKLFSCRLPLILFISSCLSEAGSAVLTHSIISSTSSHDKSLLFISMSFPILINSSSTRLNDLVNSNLKYSLCLIALFRNSINSSGVTLNPTSSMAFFSLSRSKVFIPLFFNWSLRLLETGLKFILSYLSVLIS